MRLSSISSLQKTAHAGWARLRNSPPCLLKMGNNLFGEAKNVVHVEMLPIANTNSDRNRNTEVSREVSSDGTPAVVIPNYRVTNKM